MLAIYDEQVDPALVIRGMYVVANHTLPQGRARQPEYTQLDLFADPQEEARRREQEAALEKEKRLQLAQLAVHKKFGKNALLKGTNLQEGATAMERNRQIGGHKA